jgi:hypothetical protein
VTVFEIVSMSLSDFFTVQIDKVARAEERRAECAASARRRQCDMVANCFGVPTWIIPTAPFSASAKECVTNG